MLPTADRHHIAATFALEPEAVQRDSEVVSDWTGPRVDLVVRLRRPHWPAHKAYLYMDTIKRSLTTSVE